MAIRMNALVWAGLRAGTALSLVALAAPHAMAQDVTGTIRGQVTDDAGNPISGATVTVTHVPSGTRSVQTSNANGDFSAPNLRIGGPFDVSVAAPGFEAANATVVNILAGQPQRVSVFLVPEGQTIEVTATRTRASSITLATGPATSLDARDISLIPNASRDIRNLAARDPNVVLDPTNNSISIAGQNNRFNRFSVDGVLFQDPFGLEAGGLASRRGAVPLDAIGEFTVESSPVDIQLGQFQGGAINVVLKSGSNSFDASGWFTYSDDSISGRRVRSTDRNPTGRVTSPFESRIYGAALSGPIVKDKLFFMVTWERLRDVTPSEFGLAGEGFANSIPRLTREQVTRVQDASQRLYSFDAGDTVSNAREEDDQLVAKLDWNIAPGHRAAMTYVYNRSRLLSGLTNNSIAPNNPALALETNLHSLGANNHFGVLQLNSEWSERFSTQARVSYHDHERLQVPFSDRRFGQFQVCTEPNNAGQTGASLFFCGVSGQPGLARVLLGPDISRQANENTVKTLAIELQARITGNGHDVKIIAERRGQDVNNLFAQNVSGNFYFDTLANFEARRADQLTIATPSTGNIEDTAAIWSNNIYTFGIQDTWAVNQDLTFVYGFRWDLYEAPRRPVFNNAFLQRHGFVNNSSLNGRDIFQPRFGLNWQASDRLVVRGSGGLFAGGGPLVWVSNSYSNPGPLLPSTTIQRTAPETFNFLVPIPGLSPADVQRLGAAALNNVSGGPGIPAELLTALQRAGSALANTNALDPNFAIPSTWRISGGLDYRANFGPLGDDWRLSAEVIHSRARDALTWTDLRTVGNTVQDRLPDGRRRWQALAGGTDTNTDIFLTNTGQGHSWSVVGSFDKRFDNGFEVGGAYTLQRSKDVNPGLSAVAFSNYANTMYGIDGQNIAEFGTSIFQTDDAIRFRVAYDDKLFGDNFTRVELFLNSRSGQRYSHAMAELGAGRSAVFGGPTRANWNLLYVPNLSALGADPIVRFANQETFDRFREIAVAEGLDQFQGELVPKNFGRAPRFNKLDLSLRQEIPFVFGGKVEVFADFENILNMLNRNWGNFQRVSFPGRSSIVQVACETVNAGVATAVTNAAQRCDRFVYSNAQPVDLVTEPVISIWRARLGVRVAFTGFNFRD